MEEREFWRLIEAAKGRIGSLDTELSELARRRPAEELECVLRGLSPPELYDFQQHFDHALTSLYNFDVLGALHLLEVIPEKNDFLAACNWLVLQGEKIVDAIAYDPDGIVDLEFDWGFADGADLVAAKLYHARTGQFPARQRPDRLLGEPMPEHKLPDRFPSIYEVLSLPGSASAVGGDVPDHVFEQPDLGGPENLDQTEDPESRLIRVGSRLYFTAEDRVFLQCRLIVPMEGAEIDMLLLRVWVDVAEGVLPRTRDEQSDSVKGSLANRLPGLGELGEQVEIVRAPDVDGFVVMWPAGEQRAARARTLDREGARRLMAGVRAAGLPRIPRNGARACDLALSESGPGGHPNSPICGHLKFPHP